MICRLVFLFLLVAGSSHAVEFRTGATITLREFRGTNDYLTHVIDLPLHSVLSVDPHANVGRQRYRTDKGQIQMSNGDWIAEIEILEIPGRTDISEYAGRKFHFSKVHLFDLREVHQAPPGFGNTDFDRVCEKISRSGKLSRSTLGVDSEHGITRYFTPIFPNLTDRHEGRPYRWWCLNMEGSCIVGDTLWNYPNRSYDRSQIQCKYGFGNGQNSYNATNCLNPCRTIASDQRKNKAGTVVYIPYMRGKKCPHDGRPVSGCFVVGDIGSAIKGSGRFDLFTGVCNEYSAGKCLDEHSEEFRLSTGAEFFKLDRDHPLAIELRNTNDQEVESF